MVFSDYINSLSNERISERGRVVRGIAESCMVSVPVVYNWAAGRQTPPALMRKTISDYLKMPVGDLFPGVDPNK